jgi:hypothetical protein
MSDTTTFDLFEGERLKAEGMYLASFSRAEMLKIARDLAREVANEQGITADDVRALLLMRGFPDKLGNAAGSLFRGREWEFRGQWRKSTVKTNHARMIRVWHLKGAE